MHRYKPSNGELDEDILRSLIDGYGYIRIEGDSKTHDFKRLLTISENFESITSFINQSVKESFKETPTYKKFEETIQEVEYQIKQEKDGNKKTRLRSSLKSHKRKIENEIERSAKQVDSLPKWLVQGITDWISLYNKNQIHFRVFTTKSTDGCEILANLKRECFIDYEVDYFRFAYGN